LEEKFRDVYEISNTLNQYPDSKEAFDAKIAQVEQYKKQYKNSVIKQIKDNMVFVEGGIFVMGNKKAYYTNEKKEHEVKVDDFKMSKYEVTYEQYKVFIDQTGYKEDNVIYEIGDKEVANPGNMNWNYGEDKLPRTSEHNNFPVINITWNGAMAFCQWLSKETGDYYRLPTEAEWEYVAKDDRRMNIRLWHGKDYNALGWLNHNSNSKLHPVGQKQPNARGIYDLFGNASEWCYDWYDKNYYYVSPKDNPSGPKSGSAKVYRGGYIYSRGRGSNRKITYMTFRYFLEPNKIYTNSVQGFRIVMPLTEAGKAIGNTSN
jgi:formylglycine-generating enzyme required for sulfatase activity